MDSKSGKSWLLAWETALPDATGYLGWKQIQKGSQAEANGGILVRSLEAKREFRITWRRFGRMPRRMNALSLPAGYARRAGESNLDDRGELTGGSEQVLRNRENLSFLAPEAAQPGMPRALGWKRMQKRSRTAAEGVDWFAAQRQNGNSGLYPRDSNRHIISSTVYP